MPKALYPDEKNKPTFELEFDEDWICIGAPIILSNLIGRSFAHINNDLNDEGGKLTITDM